MVPAQYLEKETMDCDPIWHMNNSIDIDIAWNCYTVFCVNFHQGYDPFYGHSLPSADSRRVVVSFWRKNVHNTG